ncbi:MAG: hypothetical protein ACFCA4_06190 [Cyanophyceae cyanobacterium]
MALEIGRNGAESDFKNVLSGLNCESIGLSGDVNKTELKVLASSGIRMGGLE